MEKGDWQCAACSFLNHESLDVCEICEAPKATTGEWACAACSFINRGSALRCEMCQALKQTEQEKQAAGNAAAVQDSEPAQAVQSKESRRQSKESRRQSKESRRQSKKSRAAASEPAQAVQERPTAGNAAAVQDEVEEEEDDHDEYEDEYEEDEYEDDEYEDEDEDDAVAEEINSVTVTEQSSSGSSSEDARMQAQERARMKAVAEPVDPSPANEDSTPAASATAAPVAEHSATEANDHGQPTSVVDAERERTSQLRREKQPSGDLSPQGDSQAEEIDADTLQRRSGVVETVALEATLGSDVEVREVESPVTEHGAPVADILDTTEDATAAQPAEQPFAEPVEMPVADQGVAPALAESVEQLSPVEDTAGAEAAAPALNQPAPSLHVPVQERSAPEAEGADGSEFRQGVIPPPEAPWWRRCIQGLNAGLLSVENRCARIQDTSRHNLVENALWRKAHESAGEVWRKRRCRCQCLRIVSPENRSAALAAKRVEAQALQDCRFTRIEILDVYRCIRHKPSLILQAVDHKMSWWYVIMIWTIRLAIAILLALSLLFCVGLVMFASQPVVVDEASGAYTDPSNTKQPVGTAATTVRHRMWDLPGLALSELRTIEDVLFFHDKASHIMRVASLSRTLAGEVQLSGTDGSSLRVEPSGRAYWQRRNQLEAFLNEMEEWRTSSGNQNLGSLTFGSFSKQKVVHSSR